MGSARVSSSSTDPRLGLSQRALAGGLALVTGSVLGLSAWMAPAQAGHGTHEQIGLPACLWAQTTQTPCMTCGMTTAFAHAADGNILGSLMAQPMGMLLAMGTAVGFWLALYTALTGSRAGVWAAVLLRPRSLWSLAALTGAAWVYKILVWQDAGTPTGV